MLHLNKVHNIYYQVNGIHIVSDLTFANVMTLEIVDALKCSRERYQSKIGLSK
jgi:hypothetical protein